MSIKKLFEITDKLISDGLADAVKIHETSLLLTDDVLEADQESIRMDIIREFLNLRTACDFHTYHKLEDIQELWVFMRKMVIKDMILKGTSDMYVQYVGDAEREYREDTWASLVTLIAEGLTISRNTDEYNVLDSEQREVCFSDNEYTKVLHANPWLIFVYAITRMPLTEINKLPIVNPTAG